MNYFLVKQCGAAVCLVCNEKLAILMDYNLKRRYESRLKDDFDKFEEEMRTDDSRHETDISKCRHYQVLLSAEFRHVFSFESICAETDGRGAICDLDERWEHGEQWETNMASLKQASVN